MRSPLFGELNVYRSHLSQTRGQGRFYRCQSLQKSRMKIVLDSVEEKVCNVLLQYAKEFAKSGKPAVTLRFTGGWVRDKLLGRPSHDIDVAIDKTTGEEFATGLHAFMVSKDIAESNVHTVSVNPEKSKHLETACTRICGLDIDFVNLRSEEYAADSRVPSKITFGTPEQDAFRRDATLNALFYNLSTHTVEDFTKKGLDDLKNGVLRTPLNPTETFSDDPLRVLRLLRFVGQLGFTIAPDTYEAMTGDIVGPLIESKVSSERVGIEIDKLLRSDHSVEAMRNLVDLGLAPYIFSEPSSQPVQNSLVAKRFSSLEWLDPVRVAEGENRSILWLSSLLQDLSDDDVGKVVQNGLHLTRVVKDGCLKLVKSAPGFDHLCDLVAENTLRRVDLGLYVRSCGDSWPLTIPFNTARLYASGRDWQLADLLRQKILELKLEDSHKLKPLVAGKELMSVLNLKPGPGIKQILDGEIEYQLENPDAGKEEVQTWLKSKHS